MKCHSPTRGGRERQTERERERGGRKKEMGEREEDYVPKSVVRNKYMQQNCTL